MESLTKTYSHLYPFSTIEMGFIKEWLEKYYKQKECKQMFDNYYKLIVLFFLFLTCRMSIALIFRDNNVKGERLSVYLGSWSVLLGGPPNYFEFICLLWDFHFIGCYFTILNKPKDEFSWIEIFGAINGYTNPDSIVVDEEFMIRIKRRERIGYFIVNNATANIAWIGVLCIIILMYINYSTQDFFTFGIFWIPIWFSYCYYCPRILYWFPLYFYLICYYLKSKLISIEKDLKVLIRVSNDRINKQNVLRLLLRRHHKILEKINSYNNFWKLFLTQCLVIFSSIILFLSYLYFFTFMPILPKLEFSIILSIKTSFLFLMLVSAAELSNKTQTTYELLQLLCLQNFSLKTKLKLMSYSERMGKTQGFSFVTNQVITRETVKQVILNASLYFLLIVQNSTNYTK